MLDGVAVLDNVVDRIFPVALDCHIDVGTKRGPHPVHAIHQAADVQIGQLIGVAVMARLLEFRVCGGRH